MFSFIKMFIIFFFFFKIRGLVDCIVKSFSRVWLFVTLWTVAYQAPQSMEFSRQEYWSGLKTKRKVSGKFGFKAQCFCMLCKLKEERLFPAADTVENKSQN